MGVLHLATALCLIWKIFALPKANKMFANKTKSFKILYLSQVQIHLEVFFLCLRSHRILFLFLKICVIIYLAPFIENVLLFPLICLTSLSWIKFLYVNSSISRLPVTSLSLSISVAPPHCLNCLSFKASADSKQRVIPVVIFLLKYLGPSLLFTLSYSHLRINFLRFLNCHEGLYWNIYWTALNL